MADKIIWHTVTRKLRDLKQLEGNPNVMDEKQFKELKESMQKYGYVEPVVINTDDTVIGGHHRIAIEEERYGLDYEVDCRMPNRQLSDKEVKELNLRLNKNRGYLDVEKVLDFGLDPEELLTFGLDDWEVGLGDYQNNDEEGGESESGGNKGWNPPKTEDAEAGDNIPELAGYSLSSFWKDLDKDNSELAPYMLELPDQPNNNLVQQKYSRTNLEEIRRIVKTYMRENEFFLENTCGWSTFGCTAAFFGYDGVGVDLWDKAVKHSKRQYHELPESKGTYEIFEGDGMNLQFPDNHFTFIYCNPPFMKQETYSEKEEDLADSNQERFEAKFLALMQENYRVLQDGCLCVITIADFRKDSYLIPLQKVAIDKGYEAGFKLWDFVIAEVASQKLRLRKKDYEKKRTVKCHEYIITFKKGK